METELTKIAEAITHLGVVVMIGCMSIMVAIIIRGGR